MDKSPDLPELSKTALQRIGRNVLNLQKMEGMLKTLVSHSDILCSLSEFPERANQLRELASTKSMGNLVGEFFKRIYSEPSEPEMPEDREEPWISFGFRIGGSDDATEAFKVSLALLVKERNQLIHQKLLSFNLHSADSCRELIASLDAQNLRLKPAYEALQGHVKGLADLAALMGEFQRIVEVEEFEETSGDA